MTYEDAAKELEVRFVNLTDDEKNDVLEMRQNLDQKISRFGLYDILSTYYLEQSNIAESIKYYKTALELYDELKQYCGTRYKEYAFQKVLYDVQIPAILYDAHCFTYKNSLKQYLEELFRNSQCSVESQSFLWYREIVDLTDDNGLGGLLEYLYQNGFRSNMDVLKYAMKQIDKSNLEKLSVASYIYTIKNKPNSFLSKKIDALFYNRFFGLSDEEKKQQYSEFKQRRLLYKKKHSLNAFLAEKKDTPKFMSIKWGCCPFNVLLERFSYDRWDYYKFDDLERFWYTLFEECSNKQLSVSRLNSFQNAFVFSDGKKQIVVALCLKRNKDELKQITDATKFETLNYRPKNYCESYAKEIVQFVNQEFKSSLMEREAGRILRSLKIRFKREVKIGAKDKNELPYDIGFTYHGHKCLIELDGKQHYVPVARFGGEDKFQIQQKHDQIKTDFAKKNGYELLRIGYKDDVATCIHSFLDSLT